MNMEILEKAETIIKERQYIQTCIKADICPKCGCKILKSHDNFEDEFSFLHIECVNCDFKHIQ